MDRRPERLCPKQTWRSGLIAIGITLALACCIVALSLITEGKTLATRTATSMVMPIGLLWLGSTALGVYHWTCRCWPGFLSATAIAAFVFVTASPYAASYQMRFLELPEQWSALYVKKPYRTAVVLGGGIAINPAGQPEVNRDGQRMLRAAQLWQAGLVSSVICTGATPSGRYNPSTVGRDLLIDLGLPPDVIFEVGGENTTQEMEQLRTFFQAPPSGFPEGGDIALLTSAFHMNRALRLASDHGLDFTPIPSGFRGSEVQRVAVSRLIPTAEAAGDCGLAWKEWLARLVGR